MRKGSGYLSLFNGDDLGEWKGLVANPIKRADMDAKTLAAEQAKADELMREGWYAEDGVLHFNGHGDNIVAAKQYGDFEMLVDWRLDKEGKEGDAGIYLRGTPQVQIWDTSRVNVGARSEEHTSELQSLMRISYAVFCLKKKITRTAHRTHETI